MELDNELFSVARVAAALRRERQTITSWIRRKIITPRRIAAGRRSTYLLDPVDCLALAIGVELQRLRFSLAEITLAVNWLRSRSLESMQRDWAEGRCVMFVVAGCTPCPRLLHRDALVANDQIDFAAASKLGIHFAGIDLQTAFHELMAKLESSDSSAGTAGVEAVR